MPLLAALGQAIDREPGSDRIFRPLRMYLIDRQGRTRNIYGLGMIDLRLLLADVATLLLDDSGSARVSR